VWFNEFYPDIQLDIFRKREAPLSQNKSLVTDGRSREEISSFRHRVQTGSGAHPAS
jgi:hypothetical protein